MDNTQYSSLVKQLVDDLKGVFTTAGLGGEAGEYKLLTQSFLYKFINDKFLYESKAFDAKNDYATIMQMSDDDYEFLQMDLGNKSAKIKREDLIESLFNQQNEDGFSEIFDATLNDIAVDNNDIYSVETAGNTEVRLFDSNLLRDNILDGSQRDIVARAIINKLSETKFDEHIFSAGFDFFSTIFEYMIKDYNKDGGGKYAEYYTPHAVAKIIAQILVGNDQPQNVRIYDPAAGSGSLLMNLASQIGVDRTTVYSQDISQKSSNLLRLNLILNGLSHSIRNIVQGNTILNNKHPEKMDFIVSNPPFKLDFSEWRDDVEALPEYNDRFFAGVPKVPAKKKSSMAIYQLFIQHIVYSLKENGKAAVVVPTGFLTAQTGIDKKIRQKLVDENWLSGVVSMPSNIFATTGTNVSVVFIDKGRTEEQEDVFLVDASKLGSKVKEDNGTQKTVLSNDEEQQIISSFVNNEVIEDFSVSVKLEDVKARNYSLSAGQYFPVKIEYIEMTQDEFNKKIIEYRGELSTLFENEKILENNLLNSLGAVKYDK
ncbi:SAM-dependent DNA methyltransferase [Ligilactobacillus agilis]|uniref:HsdM family class I SAM-dependent methyltransferase n=1 Tax=Ligilactobacillus agilis TaxID=1601 RepID=UPI001F5AF785|nr:class I SAM-dependent DNA methyltransferase [Ligilactobacillus agilis]UNL41930.1 SAM-dependent DNA methyltransferase [Ligilactobacillus agilis]UNL58698.1 SAM-dependent DNA methyltransferase [Ligilactobacillus agilis]